MLSITGVSPAAGSKNADVDSLVEFTIVDDGNGINISTLIVEVSGTRAIDNNVFQPGFEGAFSEVTADGSNYSVVIHQEADFSVGQVVSVKVQIKPISGLYFNKSYSFSTVPSEPVLLLSSPTNKDILVTPQMFFLKFEDTVNAINISSLNVTINNDEVVTSGVIEAEYNGNDARLVSVTNGIEVTMDSIDTLRNGDYTLSYSVADVLGNTLVGDIDFEVKLTESVLPSAFPQTGFFGYHQGMKRVSDLGRGDSTKLEWHTPLSKTYQSDAYVVVYRNSNRLNIFDSNPSYIAVPGTLEATVNGLVPGLTLFWAARALDTFAETLDVTGMVEEDGGFYVVPTATALSRSMDENDLKIYVDSVAGYPEKGYLLIGNTEVVRYNSKSVVDQAFLLSSTSFRGLSNTTASVFIADDEVKLFLECQDKNTVITMSTPSYQDGYESGRTFDNVGLVVTDYTELDNNVFDGFDFCGYHGALPNKVLNGEDDCGTYLGGEFNGNRGFNLFDRMVEREEVLLDSVGEPVIFIRRRWSGQTCSCMTSRRQHPKRRTCGECYGTGYLGGFTQFNNLRRLDGRLMVSFPDTEEDLPLGESSHLQQSYKPVVWTLPMPSIRDRDLILRFDSAGNREFLYEVLHVTREKLMFGHYTRQKVALIRLDKTDVQYTYPIVL